MLGVVIGLFVQLSTLGVYLIITVTTSLAFTANYYESVLVWSALISIMAVLVIVYVSQLMVLVSGKSNSCLILLIEASFVLGCLASISCIHLVSLALLPRQHLPLWNPLINAILFLVWGWMTWKVYGAAAHHEANKKSYESDDNNDNSLPLPMV